MRPWSCVVAASCVALHAWAAPVVAAEEQIPPTPERFVVTVRVDFGPAHQPAHEEQLSVDAGTTPKDAVSLLFPIQSGEVCCNTREQLLVDPQGGVQNAVVWVEMPSGASARVEGVQRMLDQHECMFEPHVMLMPAGGTLAIRNSDPVLHNIRIFRERTMLMHEWQGSQAADLAWRFDEPGRYLVRCGVHAWMYAWVVVADHCCYAVTDRAGRFTIPDVPAGSQTLRVWHETLGEHRQRVGVRAGRSMVLVRFAEGTAIQ